jgi:hypothetical protein
MSADPLNGSPGDPQSLNRYAYVQNNPVNLRDRTVYGVHMGRSVSRGAAPSGFEPLGEAGAMHAPITICVYQTFAFGAGATGNTPNPLSTGGTILNAGREIKSTSSPCK